MSLWTCDKNWVPLSWYVRRPPRKFHEKKFRKSRQIYWTVISDTSIKTNILNRHIWYVNQDILYWTVISDTSIKRRWEEIKFKNPGKRVIHVGSFWTLFKFVVTVYLGKGEEEEGDCVKVNKNVVQTLTFHSWVLIMIQYYSSRADTFTFRIV